VKPLFVSILGGVTALALSLPAVDRLLQTDEPMK
jgi:hypothetical protein